MLSLIRKLLFMKVIRSIVSFLVRFDYFKVDIQTEYTILSCESSSSMAFFCCPTTVLLQYEILFLLFFE